MTARESARKHAVIIEQLAQEVRVTRDRQQVERIVSALQQETLQLAEAMAKVREEERELTPA